MAKFSLPAIASLLLEGKEVKVSFSSTKEMNSFKQLLANYFYQQRKTLRELGMEDSIGILQYDYTSDGGVLEIIVSLKGRNRKLFDVTIVDPEEEEKNK